MKGSKAHFSGDHQVELATEDTNVDGCHPSGLSMPLSTCKATRQAAARKLSPSGRIRVKRAASIDSARCISVCLVGQSVLRSISSSFYSLSVSAHNYGSRLDFITFSRVMSIGVTPGPPPDSDLE